MVVAEDMAYFVEPRPKEWRVGPKTIDVVDPLLPSSEKKNRSMSDKSERDRIGPSWAVPREGRGHVAKENSCWSCCNVLPTFILFVAFDFFRHSTTIANSFSLLG